MAARENPLDHKSLKKPVDGKHLEKSQQIEAAFDVLKKAGLVAYWPQADWNQASSEIHVHYDPETNI